MADDSIWKKELSFKRNPKEETDDAPPAADVEESTSLWKKELSLKKSPEAESAHEAEAFVDETPAGEPVTDEPVAAEHVPGTVPGTGPDEPVWKKEVSFSRKASQDEPAAEEHVSAEHVPGTVPEPGPDETVWKKEVSFARQDADKDVVTEDPVVAEEPVPTADVPGTVPKPSPDETVWKKEVSFERKPTDAEPVLAQEPMTSEDTVAADEPVGVEESVVFDEPVVLEEPVPAEESVVAEEPLVAEEPVFPEFVALEQPFTVDPEPWNAPPALPPLPVVDEAAALEAPAPEAVVPPLPAAEVPLIPEVTATAKVPFWKKEISLGGKKGDPKPKSQKEKKRRKRKGSGEAPAVDEAPTVSVPAPELVHPPVPAAELPPLPDEPAKVPFWKKEIGGKKSDRKPKEKKERNPKASKEERAAETKEPKQPKERKQKVPKVKAVRGVKGAKGITGLKIGASQLAAARVSNNGSAELLQVAREPLAPGIVVGGELRDPDALAEALKDFFAKNGLPKRGVRLGLANNRIGVRTFEISGITDPKQLGNAVRFRAQEALPIPIDEAVLDYQVLGEGVGEEGNPTQRILLVVAYRELIDRYVDACKKAGIILSGIDLEAFALLRALQAPQDGVGNDPSAALVAVAIGHERSTFAVSDGRVCEFTRVLDWGGSALNVAIARAIDAAPSEVEGFKRALALTDEMVPDGLNADQAKKAREAIRRAIQNFARELVSSLQYYQNQPGSLGIGEIVLTGGTAHLPGISGELERMIGVRVRVGDPLARMKVSKKVGEPEQVGSLAVAIGLGIED
ncbi:MAG: type IV pilus assembly protein PilM [Gaiellaceae bacterium]